MITTVRPMDDWKISTGQFFTALGAVLVAFIGGFFTWLPSRKKSAAELQKVLTEYQTAVQDGFRSLVNEQQEERQQLRSYILDQNDVIEKQTRKIAELEGNVRQLTQVIQSLYRLLNEHGVIIPPELQKF
jgi:septal ring factor EnvC (AmiA/AmiB activator)